LKEIQGAEWLTDGINRYGYQRCWCGQLRPLAGSRLMGDPYAYVMTRSFCEQFLFAGIDFSDNASATYWTNIFINAGRQNEVVPAGSSPSVCSSCGETDMLRKVAQLVFFIGVTMSFSACATEFVTWQEEVKLNDGRVIIVTQKKRCESAYTGDNVAKCIAREAWLTINLPEISAKEIVWNEKLSPRILNIDHGKLYVVGWPPTNLEFRLYEKPRPPYIGFLFEGDKWKRVSFDQIPESIYDTNMLIEGIPPEGTRLLTLDKKGSREVNGDPTYCKHQRRIDPTYKSNFH
jgi:hypothetical protein